MVDKSVKFDAGALRDAVRFVLGLSDSNLIVFIMSLAGVRMTPIGEAIRAFATPGGELDTLAEKLSDRDEARRFAAGIMRRFAPWGDILQEAAPRRQHWAKGVGNNHSIFEPVDVQEAHRRLLVRRRNCKKGTWQV